MSKIAFIYPGQGAQVCGMGQDFYEQTEIGKQVFDLATEILGFSVPELCFTKNETGYHRVYTGGYGNHQHCYDKGAGREGCEAGCGSRTEPG